MEILIVGLGEVGTHLTKVLSLEGHRVTVVDPDPRRIREVTDLMDVRGIQGDGSRPDVLAKAGVDRSNLLLAVSNDDNVNMLSCMFGRRLGAKEAVLRLNDMDPYRRSRQVLRHNLGFGMVLSLDDLAAEEICKNIRENAAVGVEIFAEGQVQMRRLRLDGESKLTGRELKDIKLPKDVLITAIDREHQVMVPDGMSQLQPGDEVFVLGRPKAIGALEKKAGLRARQLREVVLYGSTRVAEQVCQTLVPRGTHVRVVAEDREAAERLSEHLEGVEILQADMTDEQFLVEENIAEADAFLAVSQHEERNLMTCQLAKNKGVRRTLALVHRPAYVRLYQELGVDIAVSPRLLCANRILSFVRGRSVSTIATIEEGMAEVLELEVPRSSELCGKTLKEAGLPKGCMVGAIVRESGEVVIPTGEDEIVPLDNLVVFSMTANIDKLLARIGLERHRSESVSESVSD